MFKADKKKKNSKLKNIIIGVVIVVLCLAIGIFALYHYMIVPQYIEPALKTASQVMLDENVTQGITRQIQKYYDEGKLTGEQVESYLSRHSSELDGTSEEKKTASTVQKQESKPKSENTEKKETQVVGQSKLTSGVQVKEDDEVKDDSRTHYYKEEGTTAQQDAAKNNTVSKKELATMNTDQMYEKAKSIMTPSDFSRAMAIKAKINVNEAMAAKNQGSSALNDYLLDHLTEDEYLDALDLYMKYESCLTE